MTTKPGKTTTRKSPSRDFARLAAQAACDVKAEDITVLNLSKLSGFTDYFVIATGRSDRQVQAIADRIEESLKKHSLRPISIEGYAEGHWVLLDFGSVVAHVFFQETRDFYAIEKLWADAPRVNFRLK